MKLTITDRDLLFKPLQTVSGIVERRHTLPILSNTLIEIRNGQLTLVTTDLEIEAEATSNIPELENQGALQTTVSVRKLQDILRALPSGAAIELTRSETAYRSFPEKPLQSATASGRRLSKDDPRQ